MQSGSGRRAERAVGIERRLRRVAVLLLGLAVSACRGRPDRESDRGGRTTVAIQSVEGRPGRCPQVCGPAQGRGGHAPDPRLPLSEAGYRLRAYLAAQRRARRRRSSLGASTSTAPTGTSRSPQRRGEVCRAPLAAGRRRNPAPDRARKHGAACRLPGQARRASAPRAAERHRPRHRASSLGLARRLDPGSFGIFRILAASRRARNGGRPTPLHRTRSRCRAAAGGRRSAVFAFAPKN